MSDHREVGNQKMTSGKIAKVGNRTKKAKLPRAIQEYRSFQGVSCLVFKLEWHLWGAWTDAFTAACLLFSHCVLIVFMCAHMGVHMFAYV